MCPVNYTGLDAVAGYESPDFAVVEAGPNFAVLQVDEDRDVAIG